MDAKTDTVVRQFVGDLMPRVAKYLRKDGFEARLTPQKIVELCVFLMKEVERIRSMNGAEKRALVVTVLRECVVENVQDEGLRQSYLFVVDNVIPEIIDYLVLFDKGRLKIHVKKFLACCLPKWYSNLRQDCESTRCSQHSPFEMLDTHIEYPSWHQA